MRSHLTIVIIIAALLFSPSICGQDSTSFEELKYWVGHWPSDQMGKPPINLFGVPRVAERLKQILSPPEFTLLTDTLSVESPIEIVDEYLIVSQCRPHACPDDNAVALLSLKDSSAVVVFYNKNAGSDESRRTRCYSTGRQLSELSDPLLECILIMHHTITWNGEKLLPINPWIKALKCARK